MQDTPYTLPVLAAGLVCVASSAFVYRRAPRAPTTRDFLIGTGFLALTALAYAGELASSSLEAQLGWLALRHVGIVPTPMMSLVLALRWAGHDRWLAPRWIAAMAVVPVITLALAWTDGAHHWFATPPVQVARDGFVMRQQGSGPAFWAFALYGYACMLIVAAIYVRALFQAPLRRRQGAILLAATLVPWGLNFVYLAGLSPDPLLDLSPFGYAVDAVLLALGLLHGRLFDLAPIARDRVFETLGDAVIVVDDRARLIDWNPSAARLFGRSPGDAIGATLASLVGAETAERVLGDAPTTELTLLGRTFDVRSARVRAPTGALATVLTLRDVSTEREVLAAREEALALARSASSARAAFLARMSHEVRGPLHGVLGAADLLVSGELSPAQRRYAEAITASAGSLLAIVDEILDHARLESDRIELELEDVPVRALAEEVGRMFGAAAEKKGLALEVDVDPALAARADAARLRQVLVNLVGNAVKFTDRGTIALRARREGARAIVLVSDTGIGIPEHAHARIFDPFEVGGSHRDGRAGTGLGLAIARALVEKMGGTIALESAPGRGTTFEIALPAAERAASAASRAAAAPARAREARVLVVDDDEVSRLVTCGMLEREGCTVEVRESAEEALAAYRAWRPDLVITDVRMRGTDGLALAAAIREAGDPARPTPVVALTGDVHDGARDAALRAGMREWLSKPLDVRRLREVLDAVLPGRPAPIGGGLGPAALARVLAAFHASAPDEIARIRGHVATARPDLAGAAAHALKGAAAIVGATELARACAAVELDPAGADLGALEAGYAAFRDGEEKAAAATAEG